MSLWQDLRFAARLLGKNRWFTLVAVMTLALGIAANSTVFALVDAVLLRGLPYEDADRIVVLRTRDARDRTSGVSYLDFLDWRRSARSFSHMILMGQPAFNVSEAGAAPERYAGAYVSAELFEMFGERAAIGRVFTTADDERSAPPVVMLGHGIWQDRYGGEASIIGRPIKIDDLTATVIGVMPAGMRFPPNTDVWLPLGKATVIWDQGRQTRPYNVVGRLADGVSIEQARDELAAIATRLGEDYPETNQGFVPTVQFYTEAVSGGQLRLVFLSLMGAVVFLLLIACANVANLLLARAADRSREMAVRVSIGASRWRLVRQLLVESVLLAGIAGIISVPLTLMGIRLFDLNTQDVGKPYFMEFAMDGSGFAFLLVVCVSTGIIFGLAPALHVSKTNVNDILKEGGRGTAGGSHARRWTSALLVVEIALTLVLLAGGGFMMRSFFAAYRLDLGIDTSRLLTMQLVLNDRRYTSSELKNEFLRRVDERLGTIGTIETATIASNWPMGGGQTRQIEIVGEPKPEPLPTVTMLTVGLRYPDALGVPVLRGRAFVAADQAAGSDSAMINQRLAGMYFPGADPIGQRIRLTLEAPEGPQMTDLTVVGLLPTVRQRNPQDPDPDPIVYVPFNGNRNIAESTTLLVRTRSTPESATPLIREEIRALDPDLALFNVRTMDENLARQRWPFRVFGTMFVVFALIALALAGVGLYAMTAYSVTQRTQEIGVRMALGAQPRDVMRLVLRRTLIQVAIGFTIGFAGAFGVGQLLSGLLIQISSRDPVTLGVITLVMLSAATTACIVPARRAARLDPLVALRYE